MAAQNALLVDWDVESSLQAVLDEFLVEPVAWTMYAETGEEVFLNPAREPLLREYNPNQPKRTKKIGNTKPTGGGKYLILLTQCTIMQKRRRKQSG